MTLLIHINLIVAAGCLGALCTYFEIKNLNQNGNNFEPTFSLLLFFVLGLIYFAIPTERIWPDPDEHETPTLHSTRDSFFQEQTVNYVWENGQWIENIEGINDRILGFPVYIFKDIGITIARIFFSGIIAFLGLTFSLFIMYLKNDKFKGKNGHTILGGAAFFSCLVILHFILAPSNITWKPDHKRPVLHYTKETFFSKKHINCYWRVVEDGPDGSVAGWCVKSKDGWGLFVQSDIDRSYDAPDY